MASDRTQWKQVVTGVLGSLRTVSNSALAVAQDAQRYDGTAIGQAATGATTNYTFAVARLERPVVLKECRILPGGALVFNGTNFATLNYGYTNDNSGTVTVVFQTSTNAALNTVAGAGATGTWAAGTSILVPLVNTSSNASVPSGSQLVVTSLAQGAGGIAIPGGTVFQMIWEEV